VAWERFPAEVAARIGLAGPPPRHLTGPREPLPVPAALLADVHARLREDDTDGALALLREHGLPPRARGEALAIADQLRLAFTVAASWRDRDGRANAGALGGLEAGTAGWWTFAPEDPGAGLRPSDPEAIASSLLDLLPNGATAS
jgi:hypothetical protein